LRSFWLETQECLVPAKSVDCKQRVAAVLARMELLAFPEWPWLAICLGALAAVLWLGFVPLALQGFRLILASRDRLGVTGVVLLSTVSTQSVVLVALKLLPDTGPTSWAIAMVGTRALM
jgi:hypothetical protein